MRIAILVVLALCAPAWAEAEQAMVVTKDTTLEKGAVLTHGLVIQASNVTIDGNGATLQGPGKPGDLKTFTGIGMHADGCSHVTIRNLKVTGFQSALVARRRRGWLIENCDFSGNYHDPDAGWGDGSHNGGIILTAISKSTIRQLQGKPRLERAGPAGVRRQPHPQQRLLPLLQRLPEDVDRVPATSSPTTTSPTACA